MTKLLFFLYKRPGRPQIGRGTGRRAGQANCVDLTRTHMLFVEPKHVIQNSVVS